MNGKLYESTAKDYILGIADEKKQETLLQHVKNKKTKDCGGLSSLLKLRIGVKYMITKNINIQDGLVNGACGTLEHFTI